MAGSYSYDRGVLVEGNGTAASKVAAAEKRR
jgi:hypothetical protein